MFSKYRFLNEKKRENVNFSFCIPTYRRANFLEQAINSILEQKNIDFESFEIVIVNNDPDDEMNDLIEKYILYPNIFFFSNNKNIGMLGNINQCIRLSKGKYISFLHDDDYLLPNYYHEVTRILEKYDKCNVQIDSLVVGRYILAPTYPVFKLYAKRIMESIFFFRKIFKKEIKKIQLYDAIYSWRNIFLAPTCGTIFLRDSIIEYGEIKEICGKSWDYAFFCDFSEKYHVYIVNEFLSVYRLETGATVNDSTQRDFFLFNEKLIDEFPFKFTKKYKNEMRYFNFNSFSKSTQNLLIRNGDINNQFDYSKVKLIFFMIYRQLYYYFNNLDAEKVVKEIR